MRYISRSVRIVIGLVVFVLVLNVALLAVERLTGGAHGGARSSSYNTGRDGLAAYADLLTRSGRNVVRLRRGLAETTLRPDTTIVALDTNLDRADVAALRTFVESGGRLVCGGLQSRWIVTFEPGAPSLAPLPLEASVPLIPAPETAGVSVVRSDEPGAWVRPRDALPVVGTSGRWLLAVQNVGRGRVAFLASASPLHNSVLASDDNAAFGLALAGPRSRTVVFAERAHGFSDSPWGAIPIRGRYTLLALALAALAFVLSQIRRLGPPMPAERPLPPPRRLFVESLAQTLGRTKGRRAAVAPVQAAARDRIARLAALPADATDKDIAAAAVRLGLEPDEASAVTGVAASDAAVVAAGRAYAKLRRNV